MPTVARDSSDATIGLMMLMLEPVSTMKSRLTPFFPSLRWLGVANRGKRRASATQPPGFLSRGAPTHIAPSPPSSGASGLWSGSSSPRRAPRRSTVVATRAGAAASESAGSSSLPSPATTRRGLARAGRDARMATAPARPRPMGIAGTQHRLPLKDHVLRMRWRRWLVPPGPLSAIRAAAGRAAARACPRDDMGTADRRTPADANWFIIIITVIIRTSGD
mmetsp:Transcript_60810/g.192943  ORF Transcript_60810/g.192943 Transcript_60810/m.192943 type:complete len:220 (+) Transcript_60810:377-1036(+)